VKAWVLIISIALAGCSGPELPFAKDEPSQGQQAEMVRPPWEALVKAGPGAERELDMETLDGPLAQAPPPPPAEVPLRPTVEGIEKVAEAPAKPALKAGPAILSVALPVLQGPGGAELTLAMRKVLVAAGWPVVKTPRKDALTIKGKVKLGAAKGGTQSVSLIWVVSTPDGKTLGDVKQSNDVPAGSLDQGWGENAQFAAEGAAEGVFKLIEKYR
jgi:hypothetical protein